MGQDCCQTTAPVPRGVSLLDEELEPSSPFKRFESDSTLNKSVAHSQVAIRTSNVRRMQSNLSRGVKSRLQQLPSLSQSAEEGRRVYVERSGAYYQGELLDGLPHGNGFL